ncbi:Tryptophan synthase alpha chain [Paenibacillus sp. JJ-100]|uniref:tryptophan synthase subunit alpha n=1 Tax=Paenibacillus sp. JJ-100 TaxID=2974896 RepID=UPI0022FFAF23|nr:tryptophan synthase subunit alpha [Paenibacillus sp. JJ-100]CAI6059714.1 Tryptophan synthase alpha chain [Paenibacillus sp. JJ-100]
MNLMDQTFQRLKEQNRTALMPFLTAGDPDVDTTIDIIKTLEQAGADILELGVPYSDPLADGPVIQRASERALKSQITIHTVMDIAVKAREEGVKIPFVLFTYYNPVLQTGLDVFFDELVKHDISGIIIPDLPIEEAADIRRRCDEAGVHLVPLVAPTSNARMEQILSGARGFIYCVSSLGVTGERASFFDGVEKFIETVKSLTDLPVAIGFGISSHEQVARFSRICDGVIVGSAIVRQVEEALPLLENEATREAGLLQIRNFVAQLKG